MPSISQATDLDFSMTLAACAVIASLAWLINISSLVAWVLLWLGRIHIPSSLGTQSARP